MIIDFSVQNFRSINKIQTLSFVTTGLKSAEKHAYIDQDNIVNNEGLSLFKTIGIYGANASGKSNILKALNHFIKIVTSPPSATSNLSLLWQPFLYQKDSDTTESYFQITLFIKGVKYRYGLTVKNDLSERNNLIGLNNIIIANEWLYADKNKNMSLLFLRVGNEIVKNNLPNKNKIPSSLPYKHSLYLSHSAAFDAENDTNNIISYLSRQTLCNISGSSENFRWLSIFHLNENKQLKNNFINLMSSFNLNYKDILLDPETLKKFKYEDEFPQDKIFLSKEFKEGNGLNRVLLNLEYHESAGTQKMFDLTGLLLLAFFSHEESAFIILDEIDSNFHPALLIKLIKLFNDPAINKLNSQLLFTSHDTNLMTPSIMRRDQFYFTEKQSDESTRLYSLADLKGIRNDADFAKQYLAGFYGATPSLNDYIINDEEKPDE
ncbi:ATP/GTP-binding protein [Bacteroides sp. 519]|uniref:AAA family ATPase n=1 Tax=Bacteroides sp. 519 TaxID=2302937 RepID=UPI0013D68ECF|nr:ATP-binding protein [Bacteroides sp. 519]NDV60596.1 ATP-binding protein [Bacteroides sp. 519]